MQWSSLLFLIACIYNFEAVIAQMLYSFYLTTMASCEVCMSTLSVGCVRGMLARHGHAVHRTFKIPPLTQWLQSVHVQRHHGML